MDPSHRSTLAGPARAIRSVPNGAPTFPELGTLKSTGAGALGGGPGPQGPWWIRPARVLHRRNFCSGEKRGLCVGKTKRGKGSKLMAIADSHGLPLAICAESAGPAEVKLVAQTLEQRFVADVPERLVGDKAYDSDRLDAEVLEGFGAEVIAPHRRDAGRTTKRRMVGRSVDSNDVGKWSDCLPGSTTSADWLCVTNTTSRTMWVSYSLPVLSSCSGIYEMASSISLTRGGIALGPYQLPTTILDPDTGTSIQRS